MIFTRFFKDLEGSTKQRNYRAGRGQIGYFSIAVRGNSAPPIELSQTEVFTECRRGFSVFFSCERREADGGLGNFISFQLEWEEKCPLIYILTSTQTAEEKAMDSTRLHHLTSRLHMFTGDALTHGKIHSHTFVLITIEVRWLIYCKWPVFLSSHWHWCHCARFFTLTINHITNVKGGLLAVNYHQLHTASKSVLAHWFGFIAVSMYSLVSALSSAMFPSVVCSKQVLISSLYMTCSATNSRNL